MLRDVARKALRGRLDHVGPPVPLRDRFSGAYHARARHVEGRHGVGRSRARREHRDGVAASADLARHGDTTVAPMNGGRARQQWTNVHGTDQTADETETIGQATRNGVQGRRDHRRRDLQGHRA